MNLNLICCTGCCMRYYGQKSLKNFEWSKFDYFVRKVQSNLDNSKLMGLFFTRFKLPEVQIKKKWFALREIWTCIKIPNAKLWFEKSIKCIFDSDRRFEPRRIRDIRVRDIEIRLFTIQKQSDTLMDSTELCDTINNQAHQNSWFFFTIISLNRSSTR